MTRISHPLLDDVVDVPERTVRIWERSGWQRIKTKRSTSRKLDEHPALVEGDTQPLTKED